MVKNLTSFQKNSLCLDLGCGAGRYFSFIEGETVGVDLSTDMLKRAKKYKEVNLIKADIYYLPFQKETFDFILSISVIGEYCPFDLKLLKEICSVLRSKGTFLFTVIPLHHLLLPFKKYLMFFLPLQIFNLIRGRSVPFHFGVSKFEVRNKLRKFGLEIVQIKERHGSSYPHFIVLAVRFPGQRNEQN